MPDNEKKNIGFLIFFYILVFLSFFSPRVFSDLKAGLLIIIFVYALLIAISLENTKKYLKETGYKFIIVYSIYSIGNGLHGYFKGNPGAVDFFRLNVLYYIVLWSFCIIINTREKLYIILKICIISALGVSFYSFATLAQNRGLIHISNALLFDQTGMVGVHEGYLHTTNTNLSMLIFLFPLNLFLTKTDYITSNKRWKYLCIMSVISSAIAIMISGRRAIFIVALASCALYLFSMTKGSAQQKAGRFIQAILLISVVLFVLYYVGKELDINLTGLGNRIESGFADEDEYGRSNARFIQMQSLFDGFLDNPIFGSGVGIGVDYVRSELRPWRYELSYNLLLYNAGIVGTVLYFYCFITLAKGLAKASKSDAIGTALFVAYLCGVFANATNPYFSSSFDFLWWVFIPLYYVNIKEIKENGEPLQFVATQEDVISSENQYEVKQ